MLRRALAAASLAALFPTAAWAAPRPGDAAPAFALPSARGGTLRAASFARKPLYLNFFASWCVPCNEEAASVTRLYRKYRRRGLAIVGVDEEEERAKALQFARKYNWPFPVVLDSEGDVGRRYGVIVLPVHVFIDRSGKIATYRLGEMSADEIEDAIEKIL